MKKLLCLKFTPLKKGSEYLQTYEDDKVWAYLWQYFGQFLSNDSPYKYNSLKNNNFNFLSDDFKILLNQMVTKNVRSIVMVSCLKAEVQT